MVFLEAIRRKQFVLPLTREWIEIFWRWHWAEYRNVLPLTREWIEILHHFRQGAERMSSPSYEGVDWNIDFLRKIKELRGSPSYEGVDWNIKNITSQVYAADVLPLTREWIEITAVYYQLRPLEVLPLTREWIEILYSDWGDNARLSFSLLRGSGLKSKMS